jgi:hypothetical protein
MLNYLVKIFQEECVYSIKSRLIRDNLGGYSSYLGKFMQRVSSVDFPTHLTEFYEETKHIIPWSIENILNNHTNYKAISPFLTTEKQLALFDLMTSSSKNLQINLGINTSTLTRSDFPKFCPICSKSDLLTFGEAIFYRIHQVPNIRVCPDHNCFIHEYRPSTNELSGFRYFCLTDQIVIESEVRLNQCETLRKISIRFKELLKLESDINFKEKNYKNIIESKGYLKNNKLLRTELIDEFQKYYKNVKDEYLQSRIKESYHWLGGIVINPKTIFNPFQYLLLDQFVGDMDNRAKAKDFHPFGKGPWVCINKVCDHYMKLVITDFVLESNKENKSIGLFKCSCGMQYSKSFIKTKSGLKEKIRVRNWGEQWKTELSLYLEKEHTISYMAKKLGTHISTLKKIISRKPKAKYITAELINAKRTEWKECLSKYPTKQYSQSRVDHPNLYAWLLRYDYVWLASTKNNEQANQLRIRLNWDNVDHDLSQQVKKVADRLKLENPASRISKTLIGKLVNRGALILSTNLQNLPKTLVALNSSTESTQEYQIRRVRNAVEDLIHSGKSLTKSSITKHAKIKLPSKPVLVEINSYL